jgi:hypothetical protein
MDEYGKVISSYQSFIAKYDLTRKAAYASISHAGTDGNPRISKFGGKYPRLPGEPVPQCSSCQQQLMMIAQLYLPSIPSYILESLPEDQRDKLLVLGVCPECMGSLGYDIRTYASSDLDALEYQDDVGEQWTHADMIYRRRFPRMLNSPQTYDAFDRQRQYMQLRLVSSWIDSEMVPYSSVASVRQKLEEENIPINQRIFIAAHDINLKHGVAATVYLGGWAHFCGGTDQTPGDDFVVLLNLSESEAASLEWGDAGTAQIWAGTGEHAGEFKFTVSSH